MDEKILEQIKEIFAARKEVKLAYLFGSRAAGRVGPLSDYDFAVYFDEKTTRSEMSDLQFDLMGETSDLLKTDEVDVLVLNSLDNPVLKFHTIAYSKLLLERDGYKIKIEPIIMSQYFDHKTQLERFGLTRIAS